MVQAQLHIPAFTKGKKQLSAVEVEDTRKIGNVRIHVKGCPSEIQNIARYTSK